MCLSVIREPENGCQIRSSEPWERPGGGIREEKGGSRRVSVYICVWDALKKEGGLKVKVQGKEVCGGEKWGRRG